MTKAMKKRGDGRDASDYDGAITSEGRSVSPTVKAAGDGAAVTTMLVGKGDDQTEPIDFITSRRESVDGSTRLELAEAKWRLEKARKGKNTAEKVKENANTRVENFPA